MWRGTLRAMPKIVPPTPRCLGRMPAARHGHPLRSEEAGCSEFAGRARNAPTSPGISSADHLFYYCYLSFPDLISNSPSTV